VEAIVWLDRTGVPWRDLPGEFGPWATVASRFYRWRRQGVWDGVLQALQADADARGELDWLLHLVDGSVVRAHQHAAGGQAAATCGRPGGARRGGAPADPDQQGDREREREALGRSRGGYSTKLHLRVEGGGKPMVILATAGQRNEAPMLRALLEAGAIRRPRIRPAAVAGDKGDSFPSLRRYLRRPGIRAVIPNKSNQPRQRGFDRAAYRERNRVERTINRLKQWRRVATRYEKREANSLAMVTIAAIVLLGLE
jgi:transposase